MNTYRFANKPSVRPGKPITIGTVADYRHVAHIEATQHDLRVNCRTLTRGQAMLVIGACHAPRRTQPVVEQQGRMLSIHLGGAR